MDKFGGRLRYLRTRKKLRQEDLAKELQISKSAVGMYERNEREPSFELVQKIANYFDVTTDYLLGISNTPTNIGSKKSRNVLTKDLLEYLEKSENLHVGGFPISEEQKKVFIDFLKSVYYRRNGEV